MDTVVAGKPLIELVGLCYRADRPLLLSGFHGVGKSELLKQAAMHLGIQYICRDLSLMEPADLVGLPRVKGPRTVYLPPTFLPSSGKGLLVFEELNRCERYMRAPCLQLLSARTLNDYQLPAGWLPVAAINPADDEYEVSDLDPALLSRFVRVHVVPDRTAWLEWARQNGIHPAVINYVEADDSVFEQPGSNPRAWCYVSELLQAADCSPGADQALRSAVLGVVDQKRAAAFLKTLRQPEAPLTAAKILTSYVHHRAQVQRWIAGGRVDMVDNSLHTLLKHLQPKSNYTTTRASRSQWCNLALFVSDLPADLRCTAQEFFSDRKYAFPTANGRKR